jgi:hypothetical protein
VEIQAIAQGVDVCIIFGAARREEVNAVLAIFVGTSGDLGAAVFMKTNVASVSGVFTIDDDDTITVWSTARAGGASRGAIGILTARGEEEARRREDSQSDNEGTHGFLKKCWGDSRTCRAR